MQKRFSCAVTVCMTGCLCYLHLHFTISTMDQIKKDKKIKHDLQLGFEHLPVLKVGLPICELSSRLLHCMSCVSF